MNKLNNIFHQCVINYDNVQKYVQSESSIDTHTKFINKLKLLRIKKIDNKKQQLLDDIHSLNEVIHHIKNDMIHRIRPGNEIDRIKHETIQMKQTYEQKQTLIGKCSYIFV